MAKRLDPNRDASMKMTDEAKREFAEWVKRSAKMGKHSPPYVEGKDLILLAMGPSRGQCPFDAEAWGLNTGYLEAEQMGGHITKVFIVHRQVFNLRTGNPYFDWKHIEEKGYELINTHRIKGVKAKLFPMKRICEKFSTDYFSDTICYMIAYAIDKSTKQDKNGKLVYKGPYNHLRLYGIDMQEGEEYEYEKGGIEFWLGIAKGLGIGYTVAMGSTLFQTYGGMAYGTSLNLKRLDPEGLLKHKSKPTKDEMEDEHREVRTKAPWKVIRF